MRKLLLPAMAMAAMTASAQTTNSTTVVLQGTEYRMDKLIERQIGPGTVYTRYRLPQYPLNVNIVTVDTRNPNIKIETSLPKDLSQGTELLVEAANRYESTDHHPIVAQNGNFWCVTTQEMWNAYGASTHGVSMRNGMLSIDSKSFPFWWWWTTEHSGIIGTTDTNELFIDLCRTEMTIESDKTGRRDFASCNKGFRPGEIGLYTPWFGPDRQFIPLSNNTASEYIVTDDASCNEVLLTIADGETWTSGRDMRFIVSEVRHSNGRGSLGNYDLALVARDSDVNFADLVPGDEVRVNYSWVFNRNSEDVRPEVTQAIGGNIMVMRDGQITEQNYWDGYNTMIYSRSAYGTSADNSILYMVVIDKSSDPTYGASNGCVTAEMCDLMRSLGCANLINVDAGGSAELMVDRRIINRTTEGTPRAVGNGWMVFNVAPDNDLDVASLGFYDLELTAPTHSSYIPRMVAYNKYGTIINDNYTEFEVSATGTLGYPEGNAFVCGDKAGSVELTVTGPGGCTTTRTLDIVEAQPHMRLKEIVIDDKHSYMLEVSAAANGVEYPVHPQRVVWMIEDPDVADVNEHGVIYAVKNGKTNLHATLGGMDETVEVRVENAPTPTLSLCENWSEWKAKASSGLKVTSVGEDGKVEFTYGSPRNIGTITMSRNTVVYGLPRSLVIEFVPSLPINSVDVGLRSPADSRGSLNFTPAAPFAAGEKATVTVETSMLGDPDYVGTFPLTLADIKFNMPARNEYKGTQSIDITSVRAVYNEDGGVEGVVIPQSTLAIAPNPVEAGGIVSIQGKDVATATIFSTAGAPLITVNDADAITAPSTPGLYLLQVTDRAGAVSTARLIVK